MLAGGAAAAIGGLALLRAEPAAAAAGAMQYGANNDAGASETALTSTHAVSTLAVLNPGSLGSALYAEVSDASNPAHGVEAYCTGAGHAVLGVVDNAASANAAVAATHNGVAPAANFVQANPATTHPGVAGQTAGSGPGVVGVSYGTGVGVLGRSSTAAAAVRGNNTGTGPAVYGAHYGVGAGVWGSSVAGRGGWFVGPAAQVRLVPAAGNHPATGKSGDLFVDSAKRLWFCKGSTNWVQVA